MRKTLLIIVLSLCAHNLFSQQDSLLKKFKYRIDHYRAVNFNLGAGTQFNQSEIPTVIYKSSGAAGSLGGGYYFLKSTDKILLSVSGGLGTSFYTSNSNNQTSTSKSSNFAAAPTFSVLNKWFSKKIFTELGTDASLYYNTGKGDASNYTVPAKHKRANYSVAINTGVGMGRLENITDMQNALWLYKELATEKILSRQLTADEQIELGRAITKGNNTRVLDGRRRTKFILATVDNYLQQKGVISKTDMNYFSSLNDILFFAFNNIRFAGTEKFIRLTPAVYSWNADATQNDGINKNENRFDVKTALFSFGINKYIPTNLVHQNNYGASAKLSYTDQRLADRNFTSGIVTGETKINSIIKQAGVNLFFEHVIYPNTRTAISFKINSETGYQDFNKQTNLYEIANLQGAVSYFISYRTRFNMNIGGLYQKNPFIATQSSQGFPESMQLYANAGINVSL